MEYYLLNLYLLILSVVYKISSSTSPYDMSITDCNRAWNWTGYDVTDNCCIIGDDLFTCNVNNKIDKVYIDSNYLSNPNFTAFPIFDELILLEIEDYPSVPYDEPIILDTNIFKQPSLKTLKVDSEYVEDITTDIDLNCPLEEITLNNTKIKNLPNSIFKLNKLKKIELGNNSSMNVKIVKFKNSPIECNFEKTKIDCYQEGACSNISSSNYKNCTDDDIIEILGKNEIEIKVPDDQPKEKIQSDNKNNSNSENTNKNKNFGIIFGAVIGIGIVIILALIFVSKKMNKKDEQDDNSDIEIYDRRLD